jgi:hypothetical protein
MMSRQPPPQWSRRQMTEAGVCVAIALLVALYVLYFIVDLDFEARTVRRKMEKHREDFGRAYGALRERVRDAGVPFTPGPGDDLPDPEFIDATALHLGGQPLHREYARHARLDIFSQPRAYGEPSLYVINGVEWALISRGPDGEFNSMPDQWRQWLAGTEAEGPLLYDPSNGTLSAGDLVMSSRDARRLGLD